MRVYQIRPKGYDEWLTVEESIGLLSEIENCNIGDEWEILVTEMSRDLFESLPEHDGW